MSALPLIVLSVVLIPYGSALNCHTCGSRNFLAAMIDPILRQWGTPNLIDMRGSCNDTSQLCVSQSYCYKRVDRYRMLEGGFGHDAEYWDKRCDLPPGISAATQPGKCIEYDRQKLNGYEVRRRMCVCNDRDFCNSSPLTALSLVTPIGLLLYHFLPVL